MDNSILYDKKIESITFGPISDNGWQFILMDGVLHSVNYHDGLMSKYNPIAQVWSQMIGLGAKDLATIQQTIKDDNVSK